MYGKAEQCLSPVYYIIFSIILIFYCKPYLQLFLLEPDFWNSLQLLMSVYRRIVLKNPQQENPVKRLLIFVYQGLLL